MSKNDVCEEGLHIKFVFKSAVPHDSPPHMLSYRFDNKRSVRTRAIDFGILSPDEIRRMAVCQVHQPLVYCRGVPMCNGIIDFRMGTCDRRLMCGTCNQSVQTCPGHCACIELGVPMFHAAFVETSMKVLRCVCYFCSHLLTKGEEDEEENDEESAPRGKQHFANVYASARLKRTCPMCGGPQPQYAKCATGVRLEWPDDAVWESDEERDIVTSRVFTSIEAESILTHISDAHVRAMGFDPARSHPAWMVSDVLLVPPPAIRPAIMQSSGSRLRGQDDITLKLNDINKRAADVRAHLANSGWMVGDAVSQELMDKMMRLQTEIFAVFAAPATSATAATSVGLHTGGGAPYKTLTSRLKGKDGRIRGNLMGKRVDHSARSVITPDSLMAVDDIGVPYDIAKELTVPERVCVYNIERLHARVLCGAEDVRGAHSVVSAKGTVQLHFVSREDRSKLRLQFGDVVERYLEDGDHVIFNRQPSLHRIGFLGHRVRLYPGKTFRLNLSVTAPYNADFDGDEMNLHVCQGTLAQAEVATLMSVRHQTITPQSAKPVISIVQDSLVGTYLLTEKARLLTKTQVMRLVVWLRGNVAAAIGVRLPPPAIVCPGPYWTGTQVFSLILPDQLSLEHGVRSDRDAFPSGVRIRGGVLLHGQLSKAVLGTGSGGIVDVMYRELGPDAAIEYMANVQRVIVPFLMSCGFSVSYRDAVITDEGRANVAHHIHAARENVEAVVHADLPDALKSMGEGTVFAMLSKLLLQTGAIGRKYMLRRSAIATLIDSGSKGNALNISQIAGMVGQQSVEGKRIFSDASSRTLTCFTHDDKSLLGNGFVESSYHMGLSPAEFFFHSMGGREGLVDTAVKTAHTGYIQRRMVKALEDIHFTYDESVRNARGQIVQFSYGMDAWDPVRVCQSRVTALLLDAASVRRAVCDEPPTEAQAAELAAILAVAEAARRARFSVLRPTLHDRALLPFDARALRRTFGGTKAPAEALERAVAAAMDALCMELATLRHGRHTCILAVRYEFCAKRLREAGCSVQRVPELFRTLRDMCMESVVTPGEAVGSIAAQSIGEPTTQVRFHRPRHSLSLSLLRRLTRCRVWPRVPVCAQMTLNSTLTPGIASPKVHLLTMHSCMLACGSVPLQRHRQRQRDQRRAADQGAVGRLAPPAHAHDDAVAARAVLLRRRFCRALRANAPRVPTALPRQANDGCARPDTPRRRHVRGGRRYHRARRRLL